MCKKIRLFFLVLLCGCTLSAQNARFLGPMQEMNHRQHGWSYQGMDISGDYMVSCQNQGAATVYRLSGQSFTQVAQFRLATFSDVNHANVATFGTEKYDAKDPLPVLYVSQCHRNPYEGRKDLLFAERIAPDMKGSTLMQTIFYDDKNHDFGYALQWVIDRKNQWLYGYGNTIDNNDPANRHRIIKFRLPRLSEGAQVVLRPEDALENYLIEEVSSFRFNPIGQGLYVENDKLYMPTGLGTDQHPSVLYVWDLKKKSMQEIDLSQCTTGELEDISFYKGQIFIQGQDGIFVLTDKIPFKVASIFSDHMVLQRNTETPVWGWAEPGTKVSVTTSWNKRSYAAVTDKDGNWKVLVSTPEAGGPYSMQVSSGQEKRNFTDVLIGEVWIFTGQSNMEMPVIGFGMQKVEGSVETLLASPRYADKIRIFKIKRPATVNSQKDVPYVSWELGCGNSAATVSAIGWFFSEYITEALGVPVGIIENAWGGCKIEPYMTAEAVSHALKDNVSDERLQHVLDRKNQKNRSPIAVATIWNSRMQPVAGYAARGFVWYQGEANLGDRYYDLMQTAMVQQWRAAWGDRHNKMPFMFTTIAPHRYKDSKATTRAFFVENQLRSLKFIPNAYAAVTESIGDERCIHPAKKKDVARQFALYALEKVYDEPVGLASGFAFPVSYSFDGGVATVRFENTAKGLGSASDPRIKGFELAGEDQVFHPAEAKMRNGSEIEVKSAQVPAPVAVRYNFRNFSDGDLENTFGVPVPCFRSDHWMEE